MPGYVTTACKRFNHKPPKCPQHQPHENALIIYGAKKQYAAAADTSPPPPLSKEDKTWIQQVTGVFLFYARAIDSALLPALSSIASEQTNPTENTMRKCKQHLDYYASQEEAIITYSRSDMVLAIPSDASYLSKPNVGSRAGGHFFMSNNDDVPPNNGAIINISSRIIKGVMASAAEAELSGIFIMACTAIPMHKTLEELGHKQPPTPIQMDTTTAEGLIKNKILPKALKLMVMNFHWMQDRAYKGQFRTYWRSGKTNTGNYWSKHHPASHHVSMRPEPELLTAKIIVLALRKKLESVRSVVRPVARVC